MGEGAYPCRMRPQRRVRETEKLVLPAGNLESITKHIPKPVINHVIADFGVEKQILAVFIAELESKEVFVVIRVFAEDSIVGLEFWAVQSAPSRGDGDSVDQRQVLGWGHKPLSKDLVADHLVFYFPEVLHDCLDLEQ